LVLVVELTNATQEVELLFADEPDLRERFSRGDARAFEALVQPHLDTLFTLCLRLAGKREIAEDMAQEAMAKALASATRFDPHQPFRPWLLTIARNICRDRQRSAWLRRVVFLVRPFVDPKADHFEDLASKERDALVRSALATLPPVYCEALALFHLEEMSYAELSQITGDSVSALKQRVRRGNAMLKKAMERMYPQLVSDRIGVM
jgi:RNA polymerase sigma-70 factor (ECF subfamily)